MDTSKEKIRYILQFFFDKGENASQAAANVNSVYGPDTVTANHAQFWFRRFRAGNFDVKDVPRVENVDRVRPSCKHCFDCPRAKHCTKNRVEPFA